MFTKFRTSGSPALVVAIVALVASLSGTAVAAKLLTGKQIANGSVTGADIKNKSLTKKDFKGSLRGPAGPAGPQGAQGPQGPAGTPNGYTKDEANAAFLAKGGTAADADKLDGTDGDDYVAGDAAISYNGLTRGANSATVDLITLGDLGKLRVTCGAAGAKTLGFTNSSGAELTYTQNLMVDATAPAITESTIADGLSLALFPAETDNYQVTLQVYRAGENALSAEDFTTVIVSATDDGSTCQFKAHAIDSERDQTVLVINP
jgi:hypothetical protein